ncbi:penicillin-binding protein 1A [Colwellia sp. D2M02]|uniref:penicillin-binding protein 1A n=1 Tax=Colwellia sp. D2M02 TaxID=2841562 RepID=UPI001C08F57F|nr:penicillin-binding protein 1A [Colwellia sp. D2M02]
MFSLKNLLKISLVMATLVFIAAIALYLSMRDELPDVNSLKDIQWQTPMQIYTHDGLLISQFGEKKRIPLTLDQVPQQLIDALLATEDDRFYLHFGVDPIGMGRAVLAKLMGQDKGGASTITMQVARNFFLTREVTYTRKIREIFLSFHIESLLTKDEILMLYINKIELGHRSFGFGAAAQVYYGKEINELTLPQIAVLAGLPKAPSTLNPIRSPERALARRSVVLHRMLVSGYIDEATYQEANAAPITGERHGAQIELSAPYAAEMAHQKMIALYGKEAAYTNGYNVFTTINSKLQNAADTAVTNNLLSYDQRHGYRGPILSLRPNLRKQTENNNSSNAPHDTNINTSEVDELTLDEINQALTQVEYDQGLVPAVVTTVLENSAKIALLNNEQGTIPWEGMHWARAFINDRKQGSPPKSANEILTYGDVILVQKDSDANYHLSQLPQASSAMVSMSPDDGAIKAIVGGFSFKKSQFNRVTQAKRQVGSNIKPFIYSAALEQGYTLASILNDAPINQWDKSGDDVWRPKNSPEEYIGPIRMRQALAQSKNVIAVRLLQGVGLDGIINHLTKFGFAPSDLPRNESLALGSASLTPLEIATGFAAFANTGYLISPYIIDRIENSEGEIIYQADPLMACNPCAAVDATNENFDSMVNIDNDVKLTEDSIMTEPESVVSQQEAASNTSSHVIKSAPRVISAQNAFLITEALNSAIWEADWSGANGWQGTGWRARALGRRDIAGKTGTTNEAKDAWFSGYSRRLVTTAWIGFDDPSRNLGQSVYNSNLDREQIVGGEFGGRSAQPAWIAFMKEALADLPIEPFQPPTEIVSVRIDKATGKLTNKTDRSTKFEYFRLGKTPTEYVTKDTSDEILNGTETKTEVELF